MSQEPHEVTLRQRWECVSAYIGLTLCLVVPSLGIVQKYLGSLGVVTYAIAVPAVLAVGLKRVDAKLDPSSTRDWWLTAATLLVVIALFVAVYPLANSHLPGHGSDRDDAINSAVSALLRGEYPYLRRT